MKLVSFRQIRRPASWAAALAIALTAQSASAVHVPQNFRVDFTQINGQGAAGSALLSLNAGATSLFVQINATGLEAGGPHVAHIHGLFSNGASGTPVDSTTPTISQDTDNDGFIELAEGLTSYGPIILAFGNIDPDQDGIISFSQTFDLTNSSIFSGGFGRTDLLGADLASLSLREIVIHGMSVAPGIGSGTAGEVNGTNGYLAVLPVLSGEIISAAVPEPASWALMIAGFGAVGTSLRSSRRRAQTA
jgi:hypothetical protein